MEMKLIKHYETSFLLKEDFIKWRDKVSFDLSVETCNITDVRFMYKMFSEQLKIEKERIKNNNCHPLQYGIVKFLENIVNEMSKIEDVNDLDAFMIKRQ